MRYVVALLLLLWATSVGAAPLILTCTLPTQNTDGSPLTDLDGIRFYESDTSGGPYTLVGDTTECSLPLDRPAGTYYYVATAYNAAGVESDYSGEASKTITAAPNPPSGLTVQSGTQTVYMLSISKDTVVAGPVGTVPPGTPCDSTMRFNDKYVVPRDAVNWIGTARPQVVFAACG